MVELWGRTRGIDTFCLPWRRRTGRATANMSCPKAFFLVKVALQPIEISLPENETTIILKVPLSS